MSGASRGPCGPRITNRPIRGPAADRQPLPALADYCTIVAYTGQSHRGSNLMPFPTFEPRRHDARPTNISAYSLAAFLMVIAALIAGDKPAPIAADAPPEVFSQEQREHWAYQPVKRVDPPTVKESAWVKNPIDRFILAEIEKLGMPHAPRPIVSR